MYKTRLVDPGTALDLIRDGSTVMVAGFLGVGAPETLITGLIERGVRNLTIICNDTSFPDRGVGRLVARGLVAKAITTHIGTNPVSGELFASGKMQVELVPQGTLIERIRSAGAGLGGFLTPVGVGTLVEEGKSRMVLGDKTYLLEEALGADFALIKAHMADRYGNLIYRKAARNYNPIMAMAAGTVIAEADTILESGCLDPDQVGTPGIFVDYLVPSQLRQQPAEGVD